MATITVPNFFPPRPPGLRSGLPARFFIGYHIDEQSRFLEASYKHSHSCHVTDSFIQGLRVADAPVTDPLVFHIRIPPYTNWLGWRVLAVSEGSVYATRVGGATTPKIFTQATPGTTTYTDANWYFAVGVADDGSGDPVAIDVDNNVGSWTSRTIHVYVQDDVELYAVEFIPLRLGNIGTDIIST